MPTNNYGTLLAVNLGWPQTMIISYRRLQDIFGNSHETSEVMKHVFLHNVKFDGFHDGDYEEGSLLGSYAVWIL
jgi:hypothetical protein